MKVYEAKNIRNIALLGHAGSGKTTLAESMLFQTGAINRKGTIDDNNTVSDYHELEHERGCSLFNTPLYVEYKNNKINILDTPGYDDYIGEVAAAATISDIAAIVVNAHNGIEVGTENGWIYSEKLNKPNIFLVNRLDFDRANFQGTVQELKDRFGHTVTVFQYPVNEGPNIDSVIDILKMKMYKFDQNSNKVDVQEIPDDQKETAENMRNELIESVAESDEDLMNKYFENGELSEEEINQGLKNAILNRSMFPLFAMTAKSGVGVDPLMQFIVDVLPSPLDMPPINNLADGEVKIDENGSTVLFVFKLLSEAHLGDMTFFRVYSGKVKSGLDLVNEQKNNPERFGQLFLINGKKREEVSEIVAGDIGATVKLKNTHINDTLHEKGKNVEIDPIDYPNYKVRVAVVPKTKGEEEKVGMALNSIHQEDPSTTLEHSQELRQIILYAQGELHLSAIKWRMEHRYKVKAEFIEPRVPYRETIQKAVKSSYRHKKQSGGAGQFAEVYMQVEPYVETENYPGEFSVRGKDLIELDWGGHLEYVNCIVGGVIDQRFLPAILKGIMEKMQIGPLTGSYVRDIRVYIYDGKMHPVDSNEAAFKMAGTMAFKSAFQQASPKILEPVYNVVIIVPEEFVGDVMSDLPSRRGVIQGVETEGRYQKINAKMPLAELDKYSTALRSMTQARATFNQEFAEYQAVPANVQQDLIDAYKKEQEEEE